MRITTFALLFCACNLISASHAGARGRLKERPQVKYVSKSAVYVNVGKNMGLVVGDTLTVFRGKRAIAMLAVEHLSTTSAACRIIRNGTAIKAGDRVRLQRAAVAAVSHSPKPNGANGKSAKSKKRRPRHPANEVSGFVEFQGYWQQVQVGEKLALFRPSLGGKLKIRNLAGTGVEFRTRLHARKYNRSQSSYYPGRRDEWVNRVFEIALVYDKAGAPVEFGIGRVYSPYIRGVGYIDGVHFAAKINANFRAGIAAGSEPDQETLATNGHRRKYGVFLTWEKGSYQKQRLETTVALSGSYEDGVVNREFVYLQLNWSMANRLSVYGSAEVDVNRAWRQAAQGSSVNVSNFFVTANWRLNQTVAIYLSGDARHNVHTLRSIDTPDSLFDSSLRRGVYSGVDFTLPANMRFGVHASVRFREQSRQNNLFGSAYYSIRHFPLRGQTLALRLSYVKTQFSSGYRPMASLRLPVTRRLALSLGGGGYFYETGGRKTRSTYATARADYSFLRRFYASADFRQYFGSYLGSGQLQVELGINF